MRISYKDGGSHMVVAFVQALALVFIDLQNSPRVHTLFHVEDDDKEREVGENEMDVDLKKDMFSTIAISHKKNNWLSERGITNSWVYIDSKLQRLGRSGIHSEKWDY